jgi:protein-arginine kinase activator protein McsA
MGDEKRKWECNLCLGVFKNEKEATIIRSTPPEDDSYTLHNDARKLLVCATCWSQVLDSFVKILEHNGHTMKELKRTIYDPRRQEARKLREELEEKPQWRCVKCGAELGKMDWADTRGCSRCPENRSRTTT